MTGRAAGELREALRRDLGAAVRDQEPPLDVAGCRLGLRIEPESGEALSAALAALSREGVPAIVRGGGSRLNLGNPARAARVLLCCRGLSGVDEFDAADGVLHAAAGTPLAQIAAQARRAGWELPLDPPGENATLGGALASAIGGPRRLGFGPTRDSVLGLEVVLASGQRTRCGGRVVKNVTGYDLAKLYVGSLGTLGVIEGAWLRLQPAPRQVLVRVLELRGAGGDFELAIQAARRPSARAVALVSPGMVSRSRVLRELGAGAAAWLLVCEFAGDVSVCREDSAWLGPGRAGPDESEASVDAVRALQADLPQGGVRARLHLLPSSLEASCRRLHGAGAELLVYPLPGVVHATFGPPPATAGVSPGSEPGGAWPEVALGVLDEVRRRADAGLVLEDLPEPLRADRDVFGDAASSLGLMRALKQRFDPQGILNPGRLVGAL